MKILSVLLEITPDLATRASETPLAPYGNKRVPLRSDTIRLVQNGCSFHGLRSEDPNQHLKDCLKLVDSLDLDVANGKTRYMAAHTERMERFEESIFKQREEINEKMAERFGILKELTAIRMPEKLLVKEEARHPIIKNINTISLVKMEKEKNTKNDEVVDKNVIGLSELNAIEPNSVADIKKEVVDGTNDEQVKNVKEEPEEQLV
ncbi:hypothetical protein Tco_0262177 [Tanacetum coccineum]